MSPPDVAQTAASLGLGALALARAALDAGVREQPPGSNTGIDVRFYLRRCERHGRRLGLTVGPWCAAFASCCVWYARGLQEPGEREGTARLDALVSAEIGRWPAEDLPPICYRASVAELVEDAHASGAWRDVQAGESPVMGDLLVMGRAGQDPRHGGTGHVAIVDEVVDGGFWAIGGNEGDAVRRTLRRFDDVEEPIVGWIVLR